MLSKTRDVLRHPSGMVGSILVGSIVLAILLGPVFYAYEEVVSINLGKTMLPPSLEHPLGTDSLGRDLLGRILWGGQVSLLLSVASVGIGLLLGTLVGALAGYFDGFFSGLAMRAIDALMTFPRMLLALFIIVVLGQGTMSLAIAIGLSTMPTFARITRGSTLSVRRMTYVEAAAAVGCSNARIIFRHVLPNIISPVIVQATLTMASAVILAAGLSFLGMGPPPPTPEWGAMTAEVRTYLTISPHMVLAPALAVICLVLGFNLLGDAVRDTLDPRTARLIGR